MKHLTALVVTGLLAGSTAFAASAPATVAAAPTAAKATHEAARTCHKQAEEKKLHGAALDKFMKECSAGTSK